MAICFTVQAPSSDDTATPHAVDGAATPNRPLAVSNLMSCVVTLLTVVLPTGTSGATGVGSNVAPKSRLMPTASKPPPALWWGRRSPAAAARRWPRPRRRLSVVAAPSWVKQAGAHGEGDVHGGRRTGERV